LFRELSDLEVISGGGFGVVYKAKHARFGTVVYKELDAKKLEDRYLKSFYFNVTALQSSLIQYKFYCNNVHG